MIDDKKILDRLTPVDADALRWRVMLTEMRDLHTKLDKLNMLIEALLCVCANREKMNENKTIPKGQNDGYVPPAGYAAKKEPV